MIEYYYLVEHGSESRHYRIPRSYKLGCGIYWDKAIIDHLSIEDTLSQLDTTLKLSTIVDPEIRKTWMKRLEDDLYGYFPLDAKFVFKKSPNEIKMRVISSLNLDKELTNLELRLEVQRLQGVIEEKNQLLKQALDLA